MTCRTSSARHATLLHDLEARTAGRAIAFTFRNRTLSIGSVFGRRWLDLEYHSLAILTRVNRHHRRTRHMQIVRCTAETPIETDGIVTQLQVTHRAGRHVEHDLAVADETRRYLHAGIFGIYQHVRCTFAVDDPLIQRANQIRAT